MAEKDFKTPEPQETKETDELKEAELEKTSGGLNPQPLPPSPPDPPSERAKHNNY